MTQELQGQAYRNFIHSIRSEATKKDYLASLSYFMRYLKIDDYDSLMKEPTLIQSNIIDYIIYCKEERKLAPNSIRLHVAGIKRFYDMNDIVINWKKVFMYQGENYKVVDDTAYTAEQIKTLVDHADMRDKAIILLLASIGMRAGALPKLKLKDLTEVENLYKVRVYKHTHEQYYTFCTPEARLAIDQYLEYRKRSAERLEDNTPLFRRRFNPDQDGTIVRPIGFGAVVSLIVQLLNKTGVRPAIPLKEGEHPKRTNLPMLHSFRKFFITQCIRAHVEFGARELLAGHRQGLDSHYDRRNESEILAEYSKAINYLTIDPSNRLRQENRELRKDVSRFDKMQKQIEELNRKLGFSY
jgi:integrase